MLTLFQRLWQKRVILFQITAYDIKTQYAGTSLGIAWILVGPLLLLSLYSLVYAFIFQVRLPGFTVGEYILNVFAGLIPFLAFSQALSASASCLQSEKKLLFNTVVPPEFIHIKSVLVSYTILLVGMIMILIGDIFLSEASLITIFIPIVIFFQILLSIGVGMIFSLLSLVFRDIQFLVQYIVLALMIATPITYTPDMISERLLPILYINPLFYFISTYQHLVLLNKFPSVLTVILGILVSTAMFLLGIHLFNRIYSDLKDFV